LNKFIPLILSGVLLNAFAQLLLKKGMTSIGHFDFTASNLAAIGIRAATDAAILSGLFCYVVSVAIWMLVLSRVDVSYAYPFLSVGYVVTTIIGYAYFQEAISMYRLLGVALICIGVVFVARS
jgi:multidrug transporter EmrE-like cation transporter